MDSSATRVLIVDDDRDISALLSALMNKEGLTSMMAHDGETALRMVPVARPDMLLVDVKMPGIDGMTVLKRVKETDPHLPVVLITAYAEISASVAAMRAGAFDYLSKPFEHPEVMRVVRAALAERAREQARANEELAQHNRDIGLLNEMGEMLQSCHAVAEVNDIIELFLGRLFAEDSGGLGARVHVGKPDARYEQVVQVAINCRQDAAAKGITSRSKMESQPDSGGWSMGTQFETIQPFVERFVACFQGKGYQAAVVP